jgi:hypothetical protein
MDLPTYASNAKSGVDLLKEHSSAQQSRIMPYKHWIRYPRKQQEYHQQYRIFTMVANPVHYGTDLIHVYGSDNRRPLDTG